MQRLRIVERALLPYVVLSQTVPLIALAPLVYGWSGNLTLFGLDWQPWMSVSVIAAYLAFFPVAVGALRGLSSPPPVQTELLRCYAASWWQTLRAAAAARRRVPYLIPALKLAAAAAGRRRDRGRDLDRPAGRHRAAHHHLRPAGDGRPRAGLRADHRRRRHGPRSPSACVSLLDVGLRRYQPQEEAT